MRAYDGGPACWLAQFDHLGRPCSGELEVFHFLARKEIRRILRHCLVTDLWANGAIDPGDVDDLVELAEWDPRNAGPSCEGHHRRFDSHLTPELKVPLAALPWSTVLFICQWGFESEAERKFTGSPADPAADTAASSKAGTAAGFQHQPLLVGAGADNRGGPSVVVETRSSTSAGSGESGPPTASGGANPVLSRTAASPDPDRVEGK
jgi:hypothetical protein